MRLLFITNLYPPYDIGGYEQWCHEVAVRLASNGHDVRILTSTHRTNGSVGNERFVERKLRLQAHVHHYAPLRFFWWRPSQERSDKDTLRDTIDRIDPDLVVIWGMWNLSRNLPYYVEQWMPGRVAYYLASYWPIDPDIHEEYWRSPADGLAGKWAKQILRPAALGSLRRKGYPPSLRFENTMCCSQYVRDQLVLKEAVPPETGVLLGGIDPVPFVSNPIRSAGSDEDTLRLLYFGSLVPQKGVHVAIEAMALLRDQGTNGEIQLAILGGGHPDYEALLRNMVADLGLHDVVSFLGRVNRDSIPAYLKDFDVFLFTSTWPEPFGRTIVESMASGLVVIGSDVGGSREIFQHYDFDLLFPPGDAARLAELVLQVQQNSELRSRLTALGRHLVTEHFTMARMTTALESWFLEIIGDNR
jgi:glycogen synthase